jgi:hypothetical protein
VRARQGVDDDEHDRYRRFRAVRDHAVKQSGAQAPQWWRPWLMIPTLTAAVSSPIAPRPLARTPTPPQQRLQCIPPTVTSLAKVAKAPPAQNSPGPPGAAPTAEIVAAVPAGSPVLCSVRLVCSVGCCVSGASFGHWQPSPDSTDSAAEGREAGPGQRTTLEACPGQRTTKSATGSSLRQRLSGASFGTSSAGDAESEAGPGQRPTDSTVCQRLAASKRLDRSDSSEIDGGFPGLGSLCPGYAPVPPELEVVTPRHSGHAPSLLSALPSLLAGESAAPLSTAIAAPGAQGWPAGRNGPCEIMPADDPPIDLDPSCFSPVSSCPAVGLDTVRAGEPHPEVMLHRMLSAGPGGEGFEEAAATVAAALGNPLWQVRGGRAGTRGCQGALQRSDTLLRCRLAGICT